MNISRITNIWSKVYYNPNRPISRVVIESTIPFQPEVKEEPLELTILAQGARANMFCETIEVYDGLIEWIRVSEHPQGVSFEIKTRYPSPWQITAEPGIPHRTIINFSRDYLFHLFASKVFVIDPGHGGDDTGGKGPVDMLEKNVTMSMATALQEMLKPLPCKTYLTRTGDYSLSQWARFNLALKKNAGIFISFHTFYSTDTSVEGTAVKYNPRAPSCEHLARFTLEEIIRKIKRSSRGIEPDPQLCHLGTMPALTVEPVVISNWVEEGLLRNPTLYKKIAQGIINGLIRFWEEEKREK
ncbi:N-acetylmuramoyl-L-alanine amidase [Desulfofundulus australicus DSM 11792]|uniref:N-acetylmuramoyl-L-alanine amidase n=1 Tax=Desulfofundulus australicus DSM 11792 TaxID=1121425 RepID=A0A1M4V106_9FIRM|nr:N-acetylmuramoyl-L-alanine amidase [Desulfofundulus australicus]SHE62563.1 N-acetylmuramoyl-L-alanine amidase [Desulfofundulus australicus DSM 11792]